MLVFWVNWVMVLAEVLGKDSTYRGRGEKMHISDQGGRDTGVEEAPYVVALVEHGSTNMSLRPFCTGSIITKEWVLTAAHCLNNELLNNLNFGVVAGCDTVKQMDLTLNHSTRQVRNVNLCLRHPWFDDGERILPSQQVGLYDVLLVHVDPAFNLGRKVNKISLWAKEWTGSPDNGQQFLERECKTYGWGDMRENEPTEALRVSSFRVRHGINSCTQCLDDGPTSRLICTAQLDGQSVCAGDTGGPLICDGILAGTTHVMGKCYTSFGYRKLESDASECGKKGVFTAWMYVCPMLEWIHKMVEETPPMPESCTAVRLLVSTTFLAPFLTHWTSA